MNNTEFSKMKLPRKKQIKAYRFKGSNISNLWQFCCRRAQPSNNNGHITLDLHVNEQSSHILATENWTKWDVT